MILITGGCGYLGSHCALSLLQNKKEILIIDNFSNSSPEVIDKINNKTKSITKVYEGDIRDLSLLKKIFLENKIQSVIHFAGLKSIQESYKIPKDYHSVNVEGTINLIQNMIEYNVKKIIFSSSATVYGKIRELPWRENLTLLLPDSPYAQSKLIAEQFLKKILENEQLFSVGILRYFNPIGSHPSGLIGDNITNTNNLVPSILRHLKGELRYFPIYGNDYDTKDGTCIRDYIHVEDLINGHIGALKYINKNPGFHIWNLGSGKGYSVYEILRKFEQLSKIKIKQIIKPRRKGDFKAYYADITKAKSELDWSPVKNVDDMVRDTLNYFNKNINKQFY